jgi:AraC-like DNA-binding protein
MVLERINNWFQLSKQYFFTYTDGFFNLSYLSNSPEAIIRSCIKMPFMTHNVEKQLIQADTPFMKGDFYYAELEEGLWVLNTKQYYKNNVSFKPIYDRFLASDYYFIATNTIKSKINESSYKFGEMVIENNSISFSMPGNDLVNFHFKDSDETMYMLYFNESWAQKHILGSPSTPKAVEDLFANSTQSFTNYSYNDERFQTLVHKLSLAFEGAEKPNIFQLKILSFEFLGIFYNSIQQKLNPTDIIIKNENFSKIRKIEHELLSNLHGKFMGIEFLSEKYKISPTKLKKDFKLVYGPSIFNYFQKHKMDLALNYLTNSELKIKEVAQNLGYENTSKFTQAFKKIHNKLPSEVK